MAKERTRSAKDILLPDGYSISISDLLISTLTISLLSLALPVMTLQVYDRIIPNEGSGTFSVLVIGVCVALVLEAVIRLGRSYIIGWSGAAYEHRLSCKAISHILQSDLSRPDTFSIGENLNRLSAIGKLRDFYNGYSYVTFFELIFVGLYMLLIGYISGTLAVVPAVVLTLFSIVTYVQGRNLRSSLKKRDETDDRRYNFLIESLEGVHTLKSFALENSFARRYESLEEKSTIDNYAVTQNAALTYNTAAVFSNIMIAGVIGVGALYALHGTISTGALIATILLSGRIMQPVQQALSLWAKYQDYTIAREKVGEIFEIPLHPVSMMPSGSTARDGKLLLTGVSFRQAQNGPWLLKELNLSLEHGDCIALSSDSRPSLTALLEIIAGLYSCTSGRVEVDGMNINAFHPQDLIGHVGYIHGNSVVFRGTIRENLTCFGQIPEARVQEIAALFQIDRDIARLPSGYDTFLNGNDTDTIPPGLKQRICMVRALSPKPRLILFDNADRSLDREGYNLVYNLLARLKGKATIILSSDDQNLTAQASRSFFLQKGTLFEDTPQTRENPIGYRELRL